MWQNLHDSIISLHGKLGPITPASGRHMLLESLFQARKSSGHIYVCLVYQFSLCDIFIGFWNCSDSVIFFELSRKCDIFWTVPTVWYLLSFILFLSRHVKYVIALWIVVVTYQSIYINQNIVIVNTNRNTRFIVQVFVFCLLFCRPFLSFLSLFFTWSLCCLSLLKNSLKTTKGVVKTGKWKNGHYNDKQWSMKHYTEN